MEREEVRLQRKLYFSLLALSLAIFLVANDFTAFFPVLPAMEHEFRSDITTTQWVINGYVLVFGVLIISGGRLADMYGRRNIFLIGTLLFMVFSLLGGLAINMEMLLLSRALVGVGGAMMWPSILGMTYGLMGEKRAGLAGGGDYCMWYCQLGRPFVRWGSGGLRQLEVDLLYQSADIGNCPVCLLESYSR
ncbi:MFS transporter [Microbulbifer sp. ZKSA006]|uniref:MFS transporter n=1 Tax=Microbulbifer sp. ZKSA006 TaxID=3243390 RepID=UPI0040394873